MFNLAGMTWKALIATPSALQRLLQTDSWWQRPEVSAALRAPLLRASALDALTETTGQRMPTDPVARFATLATARGWNALNWLANVAPRGVKESYGLMVNYLYDPSTIEANHESFVQGNFVARSAEVERLLVARAEERRPSRARVHN